MKALPSLAIAVAIALSALPGAALANATEPNTTFNFVPPQCANSAVKADHPTWYRIGGYCNPNDSDDHSN